MTVSRWSVDGLRQSSSDEKLVVATVVTGFRHWGTTFERPQQLRY